MGYRKTFSGIVEIEQGIKMETEKRASQKREVTGKAEREATAQSSVKAKF